MTADRLGDQTAAAIPLAGRLVTAVHDGDPGDVAEIIAGAHPHALETLCVVLAAMVPDDRSIEQLLSWVDLPDDTLDPGQWTQEQIRAGHRLYQAGDHSKANTLAEILFTRRRKATA